MSNTKEKICPKCKAYNPSGFNLPNECWFCKDLIDPIAQKLLDDIDKRVSIIEANETDNY